MKRKLFALLLAFCMLLTMLTACGGAQPEAKPQENDQSQQQTPPDESFFT